MLTFHPRYFIYRKLTYVWHPLDGNFVAVYSLDGDVPLKNFHQWAGEDNRSNTIDASADTMVGVKIVKCAVLDTEKLEYG